MVEIKNKYEVCFPKPDPLGSVIYMGQLFLLELCITIYLFSAPGDVLFKKMLSINFSTLT